MNRVRAAAIKDMDAWLRMRLALWPSADRERHLVEMQTYLQSSNCGVFVAEQDGILIGFAECSLRAYANGCATSPVGFLEGIWVEPKYRTHGISRALIEVVEFWVVSKGCRELASDVLIDNQPSQLIHAKWGFEEVERVVCFKKNLK